MKKNIDIIRALRDPAYYDSLSAEQRALVPQNPAGLIEISDDDLRGVAGGNEPPPCTCNCCTCGCP